MEANKKQIQEIHEKIRGLNEFEDNELDKKNLLEYYQQQIEKLWETTD